MDFIMSCFSYIIDMGASVMMPIILIILGTCLGIKFGDAVRSGITFGIGFIGLNLCIGLLVGTITPVANQMVDNLGFKLTAIDLGWPAAAALAWSTEIVPLVFLAILATNIIMLVLGWTKTMDIDIWNYWHALFMASFIYLVTGNVIFAVLSSVINMAIIFVLADITQKDVANVLGLEGISLPHIMTTSWALFAYPINWVLDKIPGIRDINWSTEGIEKKFGLLGEPMIVGLIIGGGLAAISEFSTPGVQIGAAIQQILIVGINISAVLILIPRMVSLLMEGLMIISEGTHEFLDKRFPGKEVYIGLDSAVCTGHPLIIATALLMIPISLFLAIILPGNTVLPLGDLGTFVFFVIMPIVASKGNLFRGLIITIVGTIVMLYLATYAAPLITSLASGAGLTVPEGAAQLSCLSAGGMAYTWITYFFFTALF